MKYVYKTEREKEHKNEREKMTKKEIQTVVLPGAAWLAKAKSELLNPDFLSLSRSHTLCAL